MLALQLHATVSHHLLLLLLLILPLHILLLSTAIITHKQTARTSGPSDGVTAAMAAATGQPYAKLHDCVCFAMVLSLVYDTPTTWAKSRSLFLEQVLYTTVHTHIA
jgi:hypothetical protein